MTIKDLLEADGIEYRDENKYYTSCPSCSSGRKKQHTKTLSVSVDDYKASVK